MSYYSYGSDLIVGAMAADTRAYKARGTRNQDDHAEVPDDSPLLEVVNFLSESGRVEHVVLDLVESVEHEGLVVEHFQVLDALLVHVLFLFLFQGLRVPRFVAHYDFIFSRREG